MPGSKYASLQNPAMYEALRRRGLSKRRAAMIANGRTPGHTVKASATAGLAVAPHGPNALVNTPGLSASRRRRTRLKAPQWGARAGQTIAGNLVRGEDGKFAAGSGGTPTARQTRVEQRRQARRSRADSRAAERDRAAAAEDRTRAQEDAHVAAGGSPKERAARRRAVTAARRARAAQAREARRQQASDERTARRVEDMADQAQRQADRERREAARQQKKPKGGGKKRPSAEERRAEQARQREQMARDTAAGLPEASRISAGDVDALRAAANQGGVRNARLQQLGFVGADGLATDQGRRALTALSLGKPDQYLAAAQDAQGRMGRERAAAQRQQERQTRSAERDRERQATEQRRQARAQQVAARRIAQLNRRAGRAASTARLKVFKDAQGRDRWVARSTTAYRDRDGEILSIAALDADSQRMTATKQYGPLRFWHIGQPDPTDAAAPWGPGVDIGDCDFSMQIGTVRIESGTFRSAAIARRVKAAADQYELSPGFFHPASQPGPDGVFTRIHTFERSLVPVRHGRASNLFTGLTVKEIRSMDPKEMARRLKVAADALGVPVDTLAAGLAQTDKTAQAQGVAFKSDDAGTLSALLAEPAGAGEIAALKAELAELRTTVKALTEKAPMAPEEMIDAGATEVADGAAEELAEDENDEPLDDNAFADLLAERVAERLMGRIDELAGRMAAVDEELKGRGYQRMKEAALEALGGVQAQVAALATDVATLKGEQPAGARQSVNAGVWGHVIGAEAAQKLKAAPAGATPQPSAGLSEQEAAAYSLIFGQ